MTEPASLQSVLEQLAEAEKQRAEPQLTSRQRRARTVARLAAVQALYQMELAGEGVDTVIAEFSNHRFDADMEGEPLAEADEEYFAEIVRGVVGSQRDIDTAVKARLASNWRLERLDSTLRALLRAGAWELRDRQDVPREIVIDEYVELAKAFFDDAEAKFVNAALDGVARDVRPKA
ncbi:MAG: transcription antitermination factor NusB [Alphaproteobacteria bacterium]|uniref:transcription antitermination factor NusB n=1 Tax=Brevundimonas sp. TaxID=1871086 RepID=UPI0018519EC6|nr:transcription antitermination factor NusB [Brevundimonas sp.]MBA3050221.1 transcription antitermination factor NusB [Brevundimonas sp.]MBU3969250.1 transcription antitermination factor NusB [Alphaproteobacteria bacterium]MBU3972643.1 transcription antitermination factor NusB [Alphaproteobacteria bacterium]MBU4136710.1 transcription antitermination factor NusB [Alphaproteobacteria bacterium]